MKTHTHGGFPVLAVSFQIDRYNSAAEFHSRGSAEKKNVFFVLLSFFLNVPAGYSLEASSLAFRRNFEAGSLLVKFSGDVQMWKKLEGKKEKATSGGM